MDISILDFILVNSLSYILGITTGLLVCCKHKDTFMTRSRSLDTITNAQYNHQPIPYPTDQNVFMATAPTAADLSPSKKSVKITLE